MSKSKPLCLAVAVAVTLYSSLFTLNRLWAGGPNFIAKQGQIRVAGQPANGQKTMTFSLNTDATGIGTVVWSKTANVYCINGVFNYPLSTDNSLRKISDLDFGNQQYYMSMQLEDGNEMLPREPLAALPYAFCASTATNLRGNGHIRITGAGDHYILNGNVGIGIINPSKPLDVNGDIVSSGGRVYDKTGYVSFPGEIRMYGGITPPTGWLLCNGAAVSRTTYAELYTVIGTAFGTGDGLTTFNLPDMRGVFPKGAGTTNRSAGKDANNNYYTGTLGTYLTDKFQGHLHNINLTSQSENNHTHAIDPPAFSGNSLAGTAHNHSPLGYGIASAAGDQIFQAGNNRAGLTHDSSSWTSWTGFESAHTHPISHDHPSFISATGSTHSHSLTGNSGASSTTDGSNGTPRYGTTTEPQSLGVNYIIKY